MDADRPSPAVEPMATVVGCSSRVQAQLVCGALQAEGLRAVVVTDDAGGVHPQLALLSAGAVRVRVPATELDLARAAVAELDAGVHALPSAGEHERVPGDRPAGRAWWVAASLLGVLLLYRAVELVWPGLG